MATVLILSVFQFAHIVNKSWQDCFYVGAVITNKASLTSRSCPCLLLGNHPLPSMLVKLKSGAFQPKSHTGGLMLAMLFQN